MVNIKKQWLLFIMALLLLSLSLPSPLLAANEPAFSLKATNRESKVIIEVKGKQLKDLYAFQFNLGYNPKHMRFIEASSPISGYTVKPIVTEGDILFAHSQVGKVKGIEGEAILATIIFERLGGSRGMFTLHGVKLVNDSLEMVELATKVDVLSILKFKDIAGHWAETSIVRASELGWVVGYSNETFRPQQKVTRAEFVAMLARALELPYRSAPELSFTDKNSIPTWARSYVGAAVEAGLIKGYSDGSFQSSKLISRAEMGSMIVRSQGIVPAPEDLPSFADTDDIPAWAQPYIAVAEDRGWIKGIGSNLFAPSKHATRAEAVHLILAIQ